MTQYIDDPEVRAALGGARALVTGGAGFIGGHLAAALLEAGAEVVLVDNRTELAGGVQADLPPVRRCTVGEDSFRQLLRRERRFDYVFHLAAHAYAAGSVSAPYVDFNANLTATVALLELLRELRTPGRLLFASSAAVYGNPDDLPITEATPTLPISPYGVSKLAAERYVAVYAGLYGLSAASLRLFSVYGPGQRKQVVYDLFAKLRATPDELVVLGDGRQVRDLVYVADVVRAFVTVAVRGRDDGFAYNVASGAGTSTGELARLVVELQQPDAAISFTGATRPGDPERWVGSCEPLAAIGGAPRQGLRDGLAETAAWFNERPIDARTVAV